MEEEEEGHQDVTCSKRRRLEEDCKTKLNSKMSLLKSGYFLQDFFNKSRGNCNALIFDNGKGRKETLTYWELDQGADLVKNVLKTSKLFSDKEKVDGKQEFVGVKCELGKLYPVLIIGILRSGNAFYNIDQKNVEASVEDGIRHLGMKVILVDGKNSGIKTTLACKVDEIKIQIGAGGDEGLAFQVFQVVEEVEKQEYFTNKFAYAIQTSGTTGQQKTILVPHDCICPNIRDFAMLSWKVTENDVIFGCAPPTFDPHIVELFSALAVGATILYTTPEVKLNAALLANVLISHGVTILQITPCLFRRLHYAISHTSLKLPDIRIIAFGGEKCPEKQELSEIQKNFSNKKVLFQNVYGVTEVSCWASVANIDLTSSEPITIGKALVDTEIKLETEPEGEIVISSVNRNCIIIDPAVSTTKKILSSLPPYPCKYRTGDIGISTPSGIIFKGRKDRVVKRNGMKVSLYQIELMTLSTGLVSYTECMLHEGKIYLLVKLKAEYDTILYQQGMSLLPRVLSNKLNLPLFMYPDYIIALSKNNIPLNGNGKIDFELILKKSVPSICSPDQSVPFEVTSQQMVHTLTPVWKSCTRSLTCEDGILHENFTEAGGTSISATRFIESAFMSLKLFGSEIHQNWEQTLLRYILSENDGTFGGIVEKLFKIVSESSNAIKINVSNFETDLLPEVQEVLAQDVDVLCNAEFQLMENVNDNDDDDLTVFNEVEKICDIINSEKYYAQSPLEPVACYKFTMGLCVDASPSKVPYKNQVIISCHGGNILCLDLDVLRNNQTSPNKAIAWKRKLPNRIEASVEIHPNSLYAYVGCHDGNFYKFSVVSGETLSWTSGGGDGAPIRSKCAIYNDLVIFLDSANSMYCVDSHSMNKLWSIKTYKLLATVSPVIFCERCLLSTLDQGIIALDVWSGNFLWNTFDINSTDLIYSSPTLVNYKRWNRTADRRVFIFVCASNKGIEARDAKSGKLLWQKTSSLNFVIQPIFSKCCDNIVWIESATKDSYKVKILHPKTGQVLGSHDLFDHKGPMAASLIYTDSSFQQRKCHLIFKSCMINDKNIALPQLFVLPLHEIISRDYYGGRDYSSVAINSQKAQLHQWKIDSETDFETFSKPVLCSEFILFGGRDNNLYAMKMKV